MILLVVVLLKISTIGFLCERITWKIIKLFYSGLNSDAID